MYRHIFVFVRDRDRLVYTNATCMIIVFNVLVVVMVTSSRL